MAVDAETRALALEREYRVCAKSFKHFFQNHWRIELPAQGSFGLPDVRPEQLETADVFQENRRVVVLKARQIGWSTIVTAYLFWKAWFHIGQTCLVFSKKEDPDALEILAKLRFGFDNLPQWMKDRGPKLKRATQTRIEFDNGSSVESDAPSDNPGRGRTLQLLVLDEFGAFPDPEGAFGSVQPAIEWGQFFVIGNADRAHSKFHKLYKDAKAGKNPFKALFYSWRVVAGRDEAWREEQGSSLSPAQLASQYPNDDEECWVAAGSPVFDPEVIREKPFHVGLACTLRGDKLTTDDGGPLRIWRMPQTNMRYAMGVDCAMGLEHGDDSTAIVMDAYFRVCAVLQGKIGSRALAAACNDLGLFYGRALMGVERNNTGHSVIDFLRDDHRYANLYFRKDILSIGADVPRQWGWQTTQESKGLAINFLAGKLPEIEVCDAAVLTQLSEFRYIHSRDGRKVEMGGSPHDDLVMALAIATQMVRELRMPAGAPEGPEMPALPPSRFEGFDGTLHALARMGSDEEVTEMPDFAIIGGRGPKRRMR